MLRSIERRFGVLMLALMVASVIGCSSTPRMVELNLGVERDARLQDKRVEVHLVGVSSIALEDWNDNKAEQYWEPNNNLRVNADDDELIHKVAFKPNGRLGPISVYANEAIWKKWRASGAMTLFIYAQGLAADDLTGENQVVKRLPIDSVSYICERRVIISIKPGQIKVNPSPRPQG